MIHVQILESGKVFCLNSDTPVRWLNNNSEVMPDENGYGSLPFYAYATLEEVFGLQTKQALQELQIYFDNKWQDCQILKFKNIELKISGEILESIDVSKINQFNIYKLIKNIYNINIETKLK